MCWSLHAVLCCSINSRMGRNTKADESKRAHRWKKVNILLSQQVWMIKMTLGGKKLFEDLTGDAPVLQNVENNCWISWTCCWSSCSAFPVLYRRLSSLICSSFGHLHVEPQYWNVCVCLGGRGGGGGGRKRIVSVFSVWVIKWYK